MDKGKRDIKFYVDRGKIDTYQNSMLRDLSILVTTAVSLTHTQTDSHTNSDTLTEGRGIRERRQERIK